MFSKIILLKSGIGLLSARVAVIIMTMLLCFSVVPAGAWNSNYKLCFTDVINTPDTYNQPPNIDGVITGDNGWTSAWRYTFNNGTFIHDVVVQGIKDGSYLYLSFEVNNDQQFNVDDVIVIAIDPTGSGANRRLIHIFPVIPSGAASPVPINYWQGDPWTGGGASPPAGTQVGVTVSGTGSNRSWFVEIRLPRAGFGIPAAGNFGMYFNVMPVDGPTTGPKGVATEYPWPVDTADLTLDLLNTPNVNSWGQATVAAATCNGVSISPSDIRTDNTPPSRISLNQPNTFRVTVHNNTIDGSGSFIPANDINATFKIANFGLPSMWTVINATAPSTNPTPSAFISANSTEDLITRWTLDAAEQAVYAAHTHQCILVELDTGAGAPPWATVFTNRSAWINMNFGITSVFESRPEIDPSGWGQPPAGERVHKLDLYVTSQIDKIQKEDVLKWMRTGLESKKTNQAIMREGSWKNLAQLMYFPAERNASWKEFIARLGEKYIKVSQLTYLVHGCRRTGKNIKIRDNEYEICKRVGSFGYVLRHASLTETNWSTALDGPGVEPVTGREGRYQVMTDKPIALRTRFEAVDAPGKPCRRGCFTFSCPK